MAEKGSDSPPACLSPDEIKKCAEISEEIRGSLEGVPGPSVTKEVAKDMFYSVYRKWKTDVFGEESKAEDPVEESEAERPKSKLSRLCTYVRNGVKEWRCKESKVSEDVFVKQLKKLDTMDLIRILFENEMEIKQHIMFTENNNGEPAETAKEACQDFAACLAQVAKDTFQKEVSPSTSEEDGSYFTF